MSEDKKPIRFIVIGRYLVDLREKRYAPFTYPPKAAAASCEADPEYGQRFTWMPGLPPEI